MSIEYASTQDSMHRSSTIVLDFIPIEWAEDGTSVPGATTTTISGNGKIRTRAFASATDDDIVIPWQLPRNASPSSIKFRVHGIVTSATGPSSESIVFEMKGYAVGDNDSISGSFGDSESSSKTAWSATQYDMFVTLTSDPIVITGASGGDLLFLNVRRYASGAGDTYNQPVGVYGITLEYSVI